MGKRNCRLALAVLIILGCARLASAIPGGQYRYRVLLDTDRNAATGCDVAVDDKNINTTVSGIDQMVTAFVGSEPLCDTTGNNGCIVSGGWEVVFIIREACLPGNTFGPPQIVSTDRWPVGQDNGVGGADVIEAFAPLADLGDPSSMRLVFTASRGGPLSDVLFTTNGLTTGRDIFFDTLPRQVPAMSPAAMAIGVMLLGMVAWWTLRRRVSARQSLLLGVAILAGAAAAWAVTIQLDGNVTDWVAVNPAAQDLIGDSSIDDSGEDIVVAFVTANSSNVFFRIDVKDLDFCGDGLCGPGEDSSNCCQDCGGCGE